MLSGTLRKQFNHFECEMSSTKDQIGCDVTCKSHSARTERDLYRICPSKLSKRELEDLYFALLENNLDLKKTINSQQEKIKVLSTKLQRITAVQKNVPGREKDCCGSKAVVKEQNESLTELKKTNERMADRIRLLNMRLCSAKQFLKRSPSQSTNSYKTCTRCSFKNSSMSALNAKRSDSNMKTTGVSCHFLDTDLSEKITQTVETEIDTEIPEKQDTEKECNENKCRNMMEELKEKVINLQEELATSHKEYCERIVKLESQVSALRSEAGARALQLRGDSAGLAQRLRTADAKCNELNMELSIEKGKVAELETGLKLANMSKHVVETIEQLAATKVESQESAGLPSVGPCCSNCSQKNEEPTSAKINLETSPTKLNEVKITKSDDSGYTELNKSCETDDDQAMVKTNRELLKKIAALQTQLDIVRISAAGESVDTNKTNSTEFESYGVETKDIVESLEGNAVNSTVVNLKPSIEQRSSCTPQAAVERDRNITLDVNEAECAAKPLEDYLITGRNENIPETNQCYDMDRIVDELVSDPPSPKRKSEAKVPREDEHNSLQIPGPVPACPAPACPAPACPAPACPAPACPAPAPAPACLAHSASKEKRKNLRNDQSSRELRKKAYSEERTVKIFENSKESFFNSEKQSGSIAGAKSKDQALIGNLKENARDIEAERRSKDLVEKKQKNVSITDVEAKLADRTPTRDSILVNRRKLASRSEDGSVMAEVKKESVTSFYIESSCTPPNSIKCDGPTSAEAVPGRATQVDANDDNTFVLCESRATICRCPVLARRDVSVFRSCSGTLRFRTTAASDKLRRCACRVQTDSFGTQMEPPPGSARRDSACAAGTYSVRERATSPDNTDREISSMTDLPSEKDGKPARFVESPADSLRTELSLGVLSPGEEKDATVSTSTRSSAAHAHRSHLSEGEVPERNVRRLSDGENPAVLTRDPSLVTSSEKMEATLKSISEELARCRQLLTSQRPQESEGPGRAELAAHALHHSAANRRIADSHAPTCVFTLHVGTLVLADESVLYMRGKSLVLAWKFYSQHAAMTRVQPSRVVQFNFVTEYDVLFEDDFLDYMKHSDMAIILCESDKQDEPFAMCSLPLREALLHANRRADMSLALVPVSSGGARDSLADEIGVLDLWCTLRVAGSLLPTIHRSMHTPSSPNWNSTYHLRSNSKVMQQAVEDDVSSERLSRDLDLGMDKQRSVMGARSADPELGASQRFDDDDYLPMERDQGSSRYYDDEVQQYRSSRPYQRRSSTQKSIPSSDLGHKGQVVFEKQWPTTQQRRESGIIVNEVPASIKSTSDMKEALQRNVEQPSTTKWSKLDDETSHIHSSIGSVKSLAARHQLSKLRWSKNKMSRAPVDSLQELLNKREKGQSSCAVGSAVPAASMEGYVKDEDSDRNLSKFNISKYIGVPGINKLAEASKKSVKYTEAPTYEEPQKENSADSEEYNTQTIDITILWVALNEECEAMVNSKIQRLYVAYTFLGRSGVDLETPFSLPKPKHYADKCFFNFKKTFHLHECDLPLLGHMSRCRAGGSASTDPRDCIVFTLVSEPPEDPLGLSSCEDIGYAYLYLGDVLAYSGGSGGYTEVVGVHGVRGGVCGVLAVRVDQLPVLRRALSLSHPHPQHAERAATHYPDDPSGNAQASMMPTFQIE